MNQNNISFGEVIKGLECCAQYPNEYGDCLGGDCPYGPRIECHKELIRDALALLKAQEQSQRDYEAATEMTEYCERYEPTYNPEDGSL